ncbi:MAG: sigma-70 family RNA polymerase sigma factor, partial [Clostridia bacterium]|nr:sigma-70 family RNA polymerase sigma factor [Clostridia bacterium]
MSFDSLSDEEIIEEYKNGSEYAVEFILSKYKNIVNSLASKYFLIGAEREDLLQEGMIGLYKACYGFKPSSGNSFKNFAYLCIERQIQSAVKAANRKKNIALNNALSLNSQFALKSEKSDDEQEPNIDSGEPSPEDKLIEEETYMERMNQIKQILS